MKNLNIILQNLNLEIERSKDVLLKLNKITTDTFIYPANLSTNLQLDTEKTNLLLLTLCKEKELSVFTVPFIDDVFFEEFSEEGTLELTGFKNISAIVNDPDLEGYSINDLKFATAYKKTKFRK